MITPDNFKTNVPQSSLDTYTDISSKVIDTTRNIGLINLIGTIVILTFIVLATIYIFKSNKPKFFKILIGLTMIIIPIIILVIINLCILSM